MKRAAIVFVVISVLAGSKLTLTGQAQQAARDYIVVFYDDESDAPGVAAALHVLDAVMRGEGGEETAPQFNLFKFTIRHCVYV